MTVNNRDDTSEGEHIIDCPKLYPDIAHIKDRSENIHQMRRKAYEATRKCAGRMIEREMKKNPLPVYKLGENVLIRYGRSIFTNMSSL